VPIKNDNLNPLGRRRVLRAAVAVSMVAMLPFGAWSEELTQVTPDTLALTGKALWAGIIEAYYRLCASGNLRAGPNDLTSTLAKFIPVGTMMSDAVAVLRAAGLEAENFPPESTQHLRLEKQNKLFLVATGKIPLGFPQRLFTESDVLIAIGYVGLHVNNSRVSSVKCSVVYTTL
jgi:hypothetical protein